MAINKNNKIEITPKDIDDINIKIKESVDKFIYKILLEISGIKYFGRGESIDEAIASLGLSWEQIKAKGDLTVSKDGYSMKHLFFPKQLRRIFANKITRMIWGKRLELLFNESKKNK